MVDVSADIAAIKALNDGLLALYNAGDFDKLVTIFDAENAVKMPPNEPILEGKEAILSSLKSKRRA